MPDPYLALKSEIAGTAYSGLTDAAIVAALNAPGTGPIVPAESSLFALLTDPDNGSLARLMAWPNLGLLKADIAAGRRSGVALWAVVLALTGFVTAGERDAILAYLAGPDPAAGPSIAQGLGFPNGVMTPDLETARSLP